MKYKYGEFTENQIHEAKDKIRKKIFFLLLLADPNTKDQYPQTNIEKAYLNVMDIINGLNSLLEYPSEIVLIQSLLEAGYIELQSPDFEFQKYRKLVLDAGAEVLNIKEV